MLLMKDIVKEGKTVLKEKAVEVENPLSEETKETLKSMMEYLHNSCDEELCKKYKLRPGVGLAAPQIGISKRMFVISAIDESGNLFEKCIINPKFVSYSTELTYLPGGEGCLSVTRKTEGLVFRPYKIKVNCTTYDIKSDSIQEETIVLKGYLSIVFNHEFDHLNGILFVDRINKNNPFGVPSNAKPIKF